ncbi:MAG: PEP-CTERM sorting domain-containing protein [Verrucomicrobiia bacterium]
MKWKLLLSILGMAAVSAFGQSTIWLDNYNTGGPNVTHFNANGPGLGAGYTMGLYYALGNVTGSVSTDPTGIADPTTLGGGLVLGTGVGSTAAFYTSAFNTPGEAMAGAAFTVPGTSAAGGNLITLMITAYNGFSYLSSFDRGHSTAFTLTTSAESSPDPISTGTAMPAFYIGLPEPSTFVLTGFALLSYLALRRRIEK